MTLEKINKAMLLHTAKVPLPEQKTRTLQVYGAVELCCLVYLGSEFICGRRLSPLQGILRQRERDGSVL